MARDATALFLRVQEGRRQLDPSLPAFSQEHRPDVFCHSTTTDIRHRKRR